ncbi:MAG: hypothetical protein IAA97_05775 [Spirochaetes bacterium]|uniref:Uncharacterized protein n=1 Tax=Candidatus Ornithospirochaeta stercoripullorum TaxID=2840899 RepID=A0A9D9E107_9SPIO|nr:hypothetical protein [Candidatus Ornithospirochaeta stercoripullorum]
MVEYRFVGEGDAAAFLDFFRAVVSETDNLACSFEDAGSMTEEDELAFIKSSISSGSFSVVAVEDGRILGSCDIRIATKARIRHRAEIEIRIRVQRIFNEQKDC